MLLANYPFLGIFGSMFIFFLFVIWLTILFRIFGDIFRRKDIGGGAKTLWIIFVIILPFLGVFIYLISQNDGMTQRALDRAESQRADMDSYVRSVEAGQLARSRRRRASSTPGRSHKLSSTRSKRRPSRVSRSLVMMPTSLRAARSQTP